MPAPEHPRQDRRHSLTVLALAYAAALALLIPRPDPGEALFLAGLLTLLVGYAAAIVVHDTRRSRPARRP